MKIRKLFAVLSLSLFTFASVGVGVFMAKPVEAKAVKATADASPATDVTLYVDLTAVSHWWYGGSNELNIWMYHTDDSAGDGWAEDVTHLGSNVYSFTLKAGNGRFKIARTDKERTAWNNETNAIDYNANLNLYKVLDEKEYESGPQKYEAAYLNMYPNNRFTVDVQAVDSFWHSDGANTYIYYVFGSGNVLQMTRISDTNVYYVDLPYGAYMEKFVIVRGQNFASEDDFRDGTKCWNQSVDIVFNSTNYTSNFVTFGPQEGGKVSTRAFEPTSVERFGDAWAYQFLGFDICTDAGGLDEHYETNWASAATAYGSLKAAAGNVYYGYLNLETYLKSISPADTNTTTRAIKRYDTALIKNPSAEGLTNFIGRTPVSSGESNVITNGDSTTLIATISIVAIVSVSAVLIFVFSRKRKYN